MDFITQQDFLEDEDSFDYIETRNELTEKYTFIINYPNILKVKLHSSMKILICLSTKVII